MQTHFPSELSCCHTGLPESGRLRLLVAMLAISLATGVVDAADDDVDSARDDVEVQAGGDTGVLEPIQVVGRRLNLVGEAISASEGRVGPAEIAARPLTRSGDLLEFVPGLVATQHSGSGKANQYFLRGFNLDHGTDFATSVDAMPVNMRTHGHGQGWTDLNFLIAETVAELSYRKGTYYADVGDFSSAGAARFELADRVARGSIEASLGEYGYQRGVLVHSMALGAGDLLYATELQTFDGPWADIDEDVEKVNLLLRYSADLGAGRGHAMVMGYDNRWSSPDQIPQRAVDAGLISEFGAIDTTVGGAASRHSLSAGWRGSAFGGEFQGDVYAIDSELDLYSNFTYLLDDAAGGDQFEQVDDRRLYGLAISQQWQGARSRWRVGLEGRHDDIGEVGLYRTGARIRQSTVRRDAVRETSIGVFAAHEFRINDTLRSYLGWRHDHYDFEVDAQSLAANSGTADDGATSLKASLVYAPTDALELYASFGQGFHSNDARGTTIRFDPVSGAAVDAVDPLVASDGAEIGARLFFNDRLQASLATWSLRLDSELLFVGDAGNTEASRPSAREGLELGMYWIGSDYLSAELEASYTRSRFRDAAAAGREIPGAIPLVLGAGVSLRSESGWMANAHLRHFGAYPLIEDGGVKSDGSTLVNVRVGREGSRWAMYLDALNVFDSRDHDVDYFYASRLAGEPAEGVEDLHFHIFQPRSLRLSLRLSF
jgi:outer membrane receptor protein involved in Fe transport